MFTKKSTKLQTDIDGFTPCDYPLMKCLDLYLWDVGNKLNANSERNEE